MVISATSLTQSGIRDWIIQRITAVVVGIYSIYLLLWLLCHPHLDYAAWTGFMHHPGMRIFSFLALLSIVFHAWVGVWTVLADYIKPYALRLILNALMVLALFAFLAWGIEILWGF